MPIKNGIMVEGTVLCYNEDDKTVFEYIEVKRKFLNINQTYRRIYLQTKNEIKKAATDRPRGYPGDTPIEKSAVVATSTLPSDRFSNLSIAQIPPEVKRKNNNYTKAHVKALSNNLLKTGM